MPSPAQSQQHKRWGIVLLTIIVLVPVPFLIWDCTSRLRHSNRREIRKQHVVIVIGNLANHSEIYGRLPPRVVVDSNDKPLSSWRLAILGSSPDGWPGKVDLTVSWNDPRNADVTDAPLRYFCFDNPDGDSKESIHTTVVAIVGKGTAFDANPPVKLSELPRNVIVLVEVSGSGIPWAAPGDFEISNLESIERGIKSPGFHVAFADQTVWCLRKDIPHNLLKTFCLVEEAAKFDREELLGPYLLR